MNAATETEGEKAPLTGTAQVARVYAEALLNVAVKQHKADAMLEQLDSLVHDVFRSQPLLESYLSSRAIQRAEKERTLRAAFEQRADATFLDFLQVLNRHDRLDLLRAVWRAYRDLNDIRARHLRVKVRSAVPLADDQRNTLRAELHDYFGLEPLLDEKVDPDLLGGMIVQIGDRVLDGSVRTKLEQLRKQLLVSSNYEIQSGRNRFGD